jgi:hypothetical protein
MLNAFDADADASDLLIEEHRDEVEQRKARIEEGTRQFMAEGMTYAAAYHKAFTRSFAQGGKRVRNTTQPLHRR